MALTPSTMLELNSAAPDFTLQDTEGRWVSLADLPVQKGLAVFFICNHCPYVIHVAPVLAKLAQIYQAQGIAFVAINSNDTDAYPADAYALMKTEKAARGYDFPYLWDVEQTVAKAYKAACTPDIFVFDAQLTLVYRGQFDDTRPHRISSGNYDSTQNPATGRDLRRALDQLLAGEQIPAEQIPSMGCNIKWKPGNEPDYY